MAYDERLAQRIRELIDNHPAIVEKNMFGGIAFIIRGHMACGVNSHDLIVRVGPDEHAAALAQPHTRPFNMTGRAMRGWVMVSPQGCQTDADLKKWVNQALAFVLELPAK